jgi:hypothetical protein
MKVAKVTVIAITQGFMFPSGVRNFDKTLFNIAAVLVRTVITLEPFCLFHQQFPAIA